MKIRFSGKEIVFIVCFALLFSAFAFAAEDRVVNIRGPVMGLDWSKNEIDVNEKIFTWDASSVFYDEKGYPISITRDRLKEGTWVSIEATVKKKKPYLIRTISLLKK